MILSIDQGTTGSRAFVFDERGGVVSSSYREFRQYYPQPGWVEHDPDEIMDSVQRVIAGAARGKSLWKKIDAIGITNQRETCVVWDARTGRPLHRAIVWQCRRTADLCSILRGRGAEAGVRRATGLVLDPYFSGTKVKWLIDNVAAIRAAVKRGAACFGTIDSWLLWNLTGGVHATDYTNASRTMMFNIHSKKWDTDLLKTLGVPASLRLPRVEPSAAPFGKTSGKRGLPSGIPIGGMCGDQQSALFGHGATAPGSMKNTYGTGCFLVLHTGEKAVRSKRGLLTTLACDHAGGPAYALEGAVFIAGALIQWLRDGLGMIRTSAESEPLAREAEDSGGVSIVPAFAGLGAPYWRPDVRGAIMGLTRGVSRAHIARAALESIAFQTADVLNVMREECGRMKRPPAMRNLRVDGGACQNDLLMQIQSDVLGIPVNRPKQPDITAWGAARLAAIGASPRRSKVSGQFNSVARATAGDSFRPSKDRKMIIASYERWKACVKKLL